jgi:hypothetical protein
VITIILKFDHSLFATEDIFWWYIFACVTNAEGEEQPPTKGNADVMRHVLTQTLVSEHIYILQYKYKPMYFFLQDLIKHQIPFELVRLFKPKHSTSIEHAQFPSYTCM